MDPPARMPNIRDNDDAREIPFLSCRYDLLNRSAKTTTTVTVLGSGDAFNSGGRAHSAYWIDDGPGAFTVDFGPTTLAQCKRLGRPPESLDAIVLTHLHGDHIGGLPVLLVDQQYRAGRTRPLTIAGPPGTAARLALLMQGAFPDVWARGFSFALPVIEYTVPGEVEVLGRRVRAVAAAHDRDHFACSIRIETSGRTLAFSGDTGWQEPLVELVRGADLFLCECSDVVAGYEAHLSLEVHTRERGRFEVRRLVLTHLGAAMRAAADRIRGDGWVLADDGDVIEVGDAPTGPIA